MRPEMSEATSLGAGADFAESAIEAIEVPARAVVPASPFGLGGHFSQGNLVTSSYSYSSMKFQKLQLFIPI